jgi:hypothetical protein
MPSTSPVWTNWRESSDQDSKKFIPCFHGKHNVLAGTMLHNCIAYLHASEEIQQLYKQEYHGRGPHKGSVWLDS